MPSDWVNPMPAYPMGKMGNCPGPRAQGGPALTEGVFENQRKRGKEKEKEKKNKREKRKKDRREGRKVKKEIK